MQENFLNQYSQELDNQEYQEDNQLHLNKGQEELLNQAQLILELESHKGFQLLQSYLLSKIQEFPNPSVFKTSEELAMAYNKQYGKAELIREYNQFIASQRAIIDNVTGNNRSKDTSFE